ncbi:MAG TPA: hypothetical protein VKT21_00870 [Thermoplasmata archaeon]|nr:hypothetical protein [Thermoplasmata archaeon]
MQVRQEILDLALGYRTLRGSLLPRFVRADSAPMAVAQRHKTRAVRLLQAPPVARQASVAGLAS